MAQRAPTLVARVSVHRLIAAIVVLCLATAPVAHAQTVHFSRLSAQDAAEITTAYSDLIENYYRQLSPRTLVTGARNGMLLALQHAHVKAPIIAPIFTTNTTNTNVANIELSVDRTARRYGSAVSAHELAYAAMVGIMSSVHDPYTVFLNPKEAAFLFGALDGGDFGGVGIVIAIDPVTKFLNVQSVVPGSPADHAALQQDDLITAIDGHSTKGLTIAQSSKQLRGKVGTTVTLTVERGGTMLPAPIRVTRATIHQVSVYPRMLPNGIAYVQISIFGRDTGAELTSALAKLKREGMRALILDLRENGGGFLTAALSVCSEFIAAGPIVSVESRGSHIQTYEAPNTAIDPLPLAVLVNGHTASASEITSGAIQDSGVGVLIGTRTFGKGVVQQIYPLPDHSVVKLTTARYFTPNNHDINHKGIQPDITVAFPKTAQFGNPQTDPQLHRAISLVTFELSHRPTPAPTKNGGIRL